MKGRAFYHTRACMTELHHRFKQVAVLKGGPSSEREVSLRSGAAVARGLRDAGYEVTEVDIQRTLNLPGNVEAVFIALHGEFGEDGQIQTLLEQRRIPYTGSNPQSSRTSFDKRLSKDIFRRAGIPTAPYEILGPDQPRTLPLPVVIKPPCQGSSIGVFLVRDEKDWEKAFRDSLQYGSEVLVEAFIPGRELTVGIVGETILPPIEILAPDGLFDYDAKYNKGQSLHLCPARLDAATRSRCQALAMQTFRALQCRGLGRADFRLMADGSLYVLELNNIPGFTETSLLPEAAKEAGISFPRLCEQIMEMAALSGNER
jgi:D-alanine-D-alanine ligase